MANHETTGALSRIASLFFWTRRGRGPVSVDVHRVEGTNSDLAAPEGEAREATLTQLRRGYNELVDTMKAVRGHLEEQSQQSARMLEVMQALPDLLRAIPESNRNQTRVLEAIHANLEHQNRASGELASALAGLTQATAKIGTHMADADETQRGITQRLTQLDSTLGSMDTSNREARDAVRQLMSDSDAKDRATRELVTRSQRQVVVLSVVSWALAIAALATAAFVAVMVGRLVGQQPAATEPADGAAARASIAPAAGDAAAQAMAESKPTDPPTNADSRVPDPDPADADAAPVATELQNLSPAGTAPDPTDAAVAEAPITAAVGGAAGVKDAPASPDHADATPDGQP